MQDEPEYGLNIWLILFIVYLIPLTLNICFIRLASQTRQKLKNQKLGLDRDTNEGEQFLNKVTESNAL
jgi:hypothetical protein